MRALIRIKRPLSHTNKDYYRYPTLIRITTNKDYH
jgi:hypothetical protein